ncbi:G-protein coupled receptor 35 [Rhynchocyon petersi]
MNKSCNESEQAWPPAISYLNTAYTASILVAGLLLNAVALWVLCCRLPRWTETRVYMVNLAAADLCLVCTLPFMLHTLKTKEEDQNALFCMFFQGTYLLNRYMSISLIVAIAVDRYLAVRHPLRARGLRSPQQAGAVCALLWLLVASSLATRLVLGRQKHSVCLFGHSMNPGMVIFSLLGFYLPMPVLVFCSLQVVTGLAQRPASDSAQKEATRKASRMVWANLVVFMICFLPLHLVLTVYLATSGHSCSWDHTISILLKFTSKLSNSNCCLDAICYYFMAKEFQEARATTPAVKAHKSQDSLLVTLT